jgi:hypothetical protein
MTSRRLIDQFCGLKVNDVTDDVPTSAIFLCDLKGSRVLQSIRGQGEHTMQVRRDNFTKAKTMGCPFSAHNLQRDR